MRIGFDGKRAVQNNTGLGNYSRWLLESLCRYYPENSYTLFAPKRKPHKVLDSLLKEFPQLTINYPKGIYKLFKNLWRVKGVTKSLYKHDIDIFHGLSGELPLNIKKGYCKSIVTVHDLIFLHYPQYYNLIDCLIYAYKFRKACQNADHIIAVSECTKRDIIHFFNINEDKISVLYQGCDKQFAQKVDTNRLAEIKQKFSLPDKFILSVGSIEERKNALVAIKALKYIKPEHHLVLIGKRTKYTAYIERHIHMMGLMDRVHILSGVVGFNELPAIYQQAEAFVYPSRYEGFGIPMIEALNSGIPAVGATGSCLEEAGGPGSLYANPESPEEFASALYKVLYSNRIREKAIQDGYEYVKRFSDKSAAQQMVNIYQRVINM